MTRNPSSRLSDKWESRGIVSKRCPHLSSRSFKKRRSQRDPRTFHRPIWTRSRISPLSSVRPAPWVDSASPMEDRIKEMIRYRKAEGSNTPFPNRFLAGKSDHQHMDPLLWTSKVYNRVERLIASRAIGGIVRVCGARS